MSAVRICVLGNDRLFSDGLAGVIRSAGHSCTVGDYDRGAPPDVVLIDSRMARALTLCAELKRERGPAVILLAAPDDDLWASRALGRGARGIVSRSSGAEEVLKAIAAVRDGLIWARRRVLAATIDLLATAAVAHFGEALLEQQLSAREREVFRHTARGLANKETAGRLGMSEATVKAHLTHIFQKLGVRCRTELAAEYYGIASPAATT